MAPQEESGAKARKLASKTKISRKPKSPKKADRRKKERAEKSPEEEWRKIWSAFKRVIWPHIRNHMLKIIGVVFFLMLLVALYLAGDVLDPQKMPDITETVSFKFAINGSDIGTVHIGLFGALCPLTVRNFIMLTTHEKGYGYKGSVIHAVIPMHAVIGGDITHGNGTGGRSALEQPFENENFGVRHAGPGYVGMLPLKDNRNSSRSSIFYITTNAMPNFDRSGVAFGKVVRGMEVIKIIEATKSDKEMKPLMNVTIEDTSYSSYKDL